MLKSSKILYFKIQSHLRPETGIALVSNHIVSKNILQLFCNSLYSEFRFLLFQQIYAMSYFLVQWR